MIKNNPIFAGEHLNAQKVRRKYDQMVKKARVDWCNSHANLSGKDGKLAHLDQIIKTLAMAHEKKSADATAKKAKKKKQDTTLARHEQSLMHGPDGMYSPAKDRVCSSWRRLRGPAGLGEGEERIRRLRSQEDQDRGERPGGELVRPLEVD
jgi:hypothetical protein